MIGIATLVLCCVLAGILGFAAHRASVCTVRAVAEYTHSGTGHMMVSIGKSVLWVFALTIPVFFLMPQTAAGIGGWQLTGLAIIGGLLFGIGAAVNGACAYSTMARMVDGEIGMLLAVAGFALGVGGFVFLLGGQVLARPAPAPGLVPAVLPYSGILAALLLSWAVYEFLRLWRTRPKDKSLRRLILAPQYRLSTAAMLIGLCAATIFLLFGSPGYTTTFQQVVEGYLGTRDWPQHGRWIVLGAVLFGMLSSTWQRRSFRIDWRPRWSWLRNILGGAMMGFGTALLPGGNDALVLYGIPSLSPHALPAYLALVVGIVVALLTMRATFGVEMRVACRQDLYIADVSADIAKRERR
jgi:uncharacterized membrane protein YedE/YeeE